MIQQPSDSSNNPLNLLRTKLFIPRPHPDLVDRLRLKQHLNRVFEARLTVISAPAGYGKTTLLGKWILERNLDVAWISLDERDNDPVRFWGYVLAALNSRQPSTGQVAQGMLQSPQMPPIESILTSLLNDLILIEQDILLVLDDYHTIDNPNIHQAIEFLLKKMPPQMHLILSSRSDPPLPLPQLRARRELVELGPTDLRFTYDEAAAFLNRVMHLELSPEDIAALERQTEGWVAGLQLAALSMQGTSDAASFISSFSGSHRYIFDYLAQEVLSKQSVEVQEFMLQTSILDRMCASLCDSVIGRDGSQQILESLEHAHLFLVSLDNQRQWYRYHHLFSDFLRARLIQIEETTHENATQFLAGLHQRASSWLEEKGLYTEALDHSFQAGDFDGLSRLIESNALELFNQSKLITLLTWMKRQPVEQFTSRPLLSIICAWAHLATSRFESVEQYLGFAETALGATADGTPVKQSEHCLPLAEIACIRANLAFHNQDFTRVLQLSAYAEDYLTCSTSDVYFHDAGSVNGVIAFNRALVSEYTGNIPEAIIAYDQTVSLSREWNNPHLLSMSISHMGHLMVLQGQLHRAARLLLSALEKSGSDNNPPSPMTGMMQANLGAIYYEWNDLENARRYLEKSIEQGHLWANWETLFPGYIGLARTWNAAGDLTRSLSTYEELAELAGKTTTAFGVSLVQADRAWLLLLKGDTTAAQDWMRTCPIKAGETIPYLFESHAVFLACFLAVLGHPSEALLLTRDLKTATQAGGRAARLLEVLLIQALAHQANGDDLQAADDLNQALTLAEQQGAVRTFLDAGPAIRSLLTRVTGDRAGYARQILEAGKAPVAKLKRSVLVNQDGGSASITPGGSGEPLSEREIEVLRLVAQGYSNQEIGDILVISTNTVKTHVKNILGRLQVSNRTQAAARAREQGLI